MRVALIRGLGTLGVAAALLAGCGSSAAHSLSGPPATTGTAPSLSPLKLAQLAIKDGMNSKGVRLHSSLKILKPANVEDSYGFLGPSGADITLTDKSGTILSAAGSARVQLSPPSLYISGDWQMLEEYAGIVTKSIPKHKWVEIRSSNKQYASASRGLTIQALLKGLVLSGKVKRLPVTTINGERVIPLQQLMPSSDPRVPVLVRTIYVTDTSQPVPVRFTQKYANALTTIDLSHWGYSARVTPPGRAVISRIQK